MTHRILVPVSQSKTLRKTVSYAVTEALESAEPGTETAVHFVYLVPRRSFGEAEQTSELFSQIDVWAREDMGDESDESPVSVETATIGGGRYLFNPADYADVINEYVQSKDINRIILDPEYAPAGQTPLIEPFSAELETDSVTVEQAPVERPARRVRIGTRLLPGKFAATFAISFGFYLLLGDPFYWFDLLTGVATGLLTAALLSRVTFIHEPHFRRTGRQLARMCLFVPYLLWEIAKANLQMAYVILHPSLPIDPEVVEYDAAVWGSLPITTLANSITLTPGTLTIDVIEDQFHVHALVPATAEGLLDGALERAVRFVYYGRSAMRIASPRERRQTREGSD